MRRVSRHGVDALPTILRSKTYGERSKKLLCDMETSLPANPFSMFCLLMTSTHVVVSTAAMHRNDGDTTEWYVVLR